MSLEQQVDRAVEISRDRDVDIYFGDLAEMTEGAPTLKQRFLTDDETFYDWLPDAAAGAQDEMTLCAMRPMFEAIEDGSEDYNELGHYFHSMVMAYIETASREAE